jgi:hypothetical protein
MNCGNISNMKRKLILNLVFIVFIYNTSFAGEKEVGCSQLSRIAEVIMISRQKGLPASKLINTLQPSFNSMNSKSPLKTLTLDMVEMA